MSEEITEAAEGTATPSTDDPGDLDRALAFAASRKHLFGDAPSVRLGRYTLLRKLGAGGMGVVYLAYDEDLDRRVAIKLLTEGRAAQRGGREKVIAEARAMAKLSHPNVATVHEVGEDDQGRLFVAMEYVKGQSLRELLRERPPWREGLQLMVQAARGLLAAHEAGVVHRDFKPDNAMVGDDGRVRVLDFGLAATTGPDGDAATSGVAGTPAYMAPEQLVGEAIDARADQYAWGVATYEMLYGERPGRTTIERLAGAEASSDRKEIPAWLADILHKTRETDPAKRYTGLAEPLAAIESQLHRGARWPMVAGIAVAGTLGAGAMWAATQAPDPCEGVAAPVHEVWNAAAKEAFEAEFAKVDVPFAAEVGSDLAGRLNAWSKVWGETAEEVCHAQHVTQTLSPSEGRQRDTCLEDRLLELEGWLGAFAELDVNAVVQAHEAFERLGSVKGCLDPEVLASYAVDPSASEDERGHFRGELALANTLRDLARDEEAMAVLDELESSLSFNPSRRARLERIRASVLRREKPAEAEASARRGYMAALSGGDSNAAFSLAIDLASYLDEERDRADETKLWLEMAEAQMIASGSPVPHRIDLAAGQATALLRGGEYEGAIEKAREALALQKEFGQPSPAVLTHLAGALFDSGEYAEARDVWRQTLEIERAHYGEAHPEIAGTLTSIANTHDQLGETAKSLELRREAIAMTEATVGPESNPAAHARLGLCSSLAALGRYEDAATECGVAEKLYEKLHGPHHQATSVARYNRVLGLRKSGRLDEAQAIVESEIERIETITKGPSVDLADTVESLGNVLLERERPQEALEVFERAHRIREEHFGDSPHPDFGYSWQAKGQAYEAMGSRQQAIDAFERAIEVWSETLGDHHPNLVGVLVSTAQLDPGRTDRVGNHVLGIADAPDLDNTVRCSIRLDGAELLTEPARAEQVARAVLKDCDEPELVSRAEALVGR